MHEILMYIGSVLIFAWGVGHLIPTRSVVAGLGELNGDGRRVATMEWLAEGLTLCFLGLLGVIVTMGGGLDHPVGRAVIRATAAMLFVMAGLTAATGARTSIKPMKACPVVKSMVAALFVAAAGMH